MPLTFCLAMVPVYLKVFVWSVTVATALARPDGAPEDACETMEPAHNTVPQTGPFPYSLMMDTNRINSDGCVYFTIKAKPPNTFTGFMVQARGEREDRPVGVFTEGEDVKLMECFGEPDVSIDSVVLSGFNL